MTVRLILFDIDGTLVDAGGAGRRALISAFAEQFRPESLGPAEEVPFAGFTDRKIFRDMARALDLDEAAFNAGEGEFRRRYARALKRELESSSVRGRGVLPGVRALVETLATRSDAQMGLLTGNIEIGARIKLERFDLYRFFPAGGFGDEADDRRGVARVARDKLAAHYGIDFAPDDVVVIGDTGNDIDCARANGFRAIAVDTGWAAPGTLAAAEPDALFEDLSDTDAVLAALL